MAKLFSGFHGLLTAVVLLLVVAFFAGREAFMASDGGALIQLAANRPIVYAVPVQVEHPWWHPRRWFMSPWARHGRFWNPPEIVQVY